MATAVVPAKTRRGWMTDERQLDRYINIRLAALGQPTSRATAEAYLSEFAEPLVRGDELGLPPGPEVGRLLDLIAEERAVGTISTRDEALELARREARK